MLYAKKNESVSIFAPKYRAIINGTSIPPALPNSVNKVVLVISLFRLLAFAKNEICLFKHKFDFINYITRLNASHTVSMTKWAFSINIIFTDIQKM